VLSNLLVPLAGLIDIAFLGHLSEVRHLAGVALATVLFNYIYWSFGFLRMGTTGITAQAMGREEPDEVLLIGLRHGMIALLIGLGILLLQWPLKVVGFWLLSASPEVKRSGEAFYDALIWGAPATLLGFVLIGWFLGRAEGGKVLVLTAVSSSTNVILDYWLIVRLGWGSAGAGAATAISQYLVVLVGMGLLLRELRPAHWRGMSRRGWDRLWDRLWDRVALRQLLRLNGEIFLRTLTLVTTFALFTNLSSGFGTNVLAANTLLLQAITFAAYFIDGLAFATESLAGLLSGRGRGGLQQLLWLAGSLSLGLGLLFGCLYISQSALLFGRLTRHAELLSLVQRYVIWLLPILGFGSIAYMLDGYFLGLAQGRILRQSSILATLLGFVPAAVLAWHLHNLDLLWLALTLFMLMRALTLGLNLAGTLRMACPDRLDSDAPSLGAPSANKGIPLE
jgi:MATE family multidrug resistance protein